VLPSIDWFHRSLDLNYVHLDQKCSLTATEHCGRVVNTPASYWGGSGFKSWRRDRLPDWGFLGFPQSLQTIAMIVPKN
jgi:hypothetical protein